MTKLSLCFRVLPCLLAAGLVGHAAVRADDAGALTPAPAWTLKDVNGKAVSLDQFRGKVVVLDFWATWCPPCRAEIPGYVQLQKKYAKDGLAVVGVSLDQGGVEVVKQFIADHHVDYQIVMGDQKIVDAYGGVNAIPTTFIIDRQGNIRYRKVGEMPTADFEAILRRYL